MIRLILLSFIFVSCAHNSSYYKIAKKDNKLSAHSLYRTPASVSNKVTSEQSIMNMCYTSPGDVNLAELFSRGEKKYADLNYWITLANCLKEKKQYTASYQILKKALSLATTQKHRESIYNNLLALALLKNNDFLAHSYVNILTSYKRLTPLTLFNLGNYHLISKQYLQAEMFYKRAARIGQGDLDIMLGIARAQIGQKRYVHALKQLKKIDTQYIKRSDIAITYAYTLLKLDKLVQAQDIVSHISKYIKNEQEIAERYLELIEKRIELKSAKKT